MRSRDKAENKGEEHGHAKNDCPLDVLAHAVARGHEDCARNIDLRNVAGARGLLAFGTSVYAHSALFSNSFRGFGLVAFVGIPGQDPPARLLAKSQWLGALAAQAHRWYAFHAFDQSFPNVRVGTGIGVGRMSLEYLRMSFKTEAQLTEPVCCRPRNVETPSRLSLTTNASPRRPATWMIVLTA
jgi:hypothetical protein